MINREEYRILRDLNPGSAHLFKYGNLGDIGFLWNHPRILDLLIKRSEAKSLEPFIFDRFAPERGGGFIWKNSPEGRAFWERVLGEREPVHFYEQYGPDEAPTE